MLTHTFLIAIRIDMQKIARRLRGWRKDRGLSQREAAELAGISQPAWCQYEAGKVPIDIRVITCLVRVTRDHPRYSLDFAMFTPTVTTT